MDATGFDHLTRLLVTPASRRTLLRRSATTLGLVALGPIGAVAKAKHGHKHHGKKNDKPKPPRPNAYGCLNVGQPCRGNDALCCSGVCAGKKPKQGKRDKRKCAAHNTGGCTAAHDTCAVNQAVHCLTDGACFRTTGEANFCGKGGWMCMDCETDADCLLWGPGAACVVCPVVCPHTTTACFAAAG